MKIELTLCEALTLNRALSSYRERLQYFNSREISEKARKSNERQLADISEIEKKIGE